MLVAGGTISQGGNIFAGSVWEFLRRPSLVSFGIVRSAAIALTPTVSFFVGSRLAAVFNIFGQSVTVAGSLQNGPKFPEDFYVINEPGVAGDRLQAVSTGSSGVTAWALIITEVG